MCPDGGSWFSALSLALCSVGVHVEGALLGGALIFGLMIQFLPRGPAAGLPSHPHSILDSALAKEESSGLSGPQGVLPLARPGALRPWK